MRLDNLLYEDFANDIVQTVQFSKTKLTDKHVDHIINEVSKLTGAPKQTITDGILARIAPIQQYKAITPILYSTIAENSIEQESFRLLEKYGVKHPDTGKFSLRTFHKLVDYIKAEHSEFFPLRDIQSNRGLKEVYKFVGENGSPEDNKNYASVKTAAAQRNGVFIFNEKFMQDLMEFAKIKGIRPKGKKYQSNGGPIPDVYAYIEFLIIHEYMHYTQADWDLSDIYKIPDDISNWAGDFRNNYTLVKHGLEQLPVGLFSSHINYDRQNTFEEMANIVRDEMAKLDQQQKQDLKERLDKMGDDHQPSAGDPGDADGNPTSKAGDAGKPSDKDADGKPSDKKTGQGDKPSDDKAGDPDAKKDVDARHRDIQDKLGKRDENETPESASEKAGNGNGEGKGGPSSGNSTTTREVKWQYTPPKFNWRKLLDKIVSNATAQSEETYLKPSNSVATSVGILAQVGKSAVKPGEIKPEGNIKVCVLVDSSGSMSSAIGKIYNEITSLLKKYKRLDNTFGFMRFSDNFELFKVNINKQTYTKVANMKDKAKLSGGNVQSLFSEHYGAGTNFSPALLAKCKQIIAEGYILIIVSDTDVLQGSNLSNFKAALETRNSFMIFASESDYTEALHSIGARSNMTFMS